MLTKIDAAVAWCVATAEDDSHGYDQGERWGPADYDCSSLLITGWEFAGVPVKTKYGARRTANMYEGFTKAGFIDVTSQINMATGEGTRKGDVWLTPHDHTAMVCTTKDGIRFVEAHGNEFGGRVDGQPGDQTGGELAVVKWHTNSPDWVYVLRYPGGSSESLTADKSTVISNNTYLTREEMTHNAVYIAAVLLSKGWTLNAVAGVLGNMEAESTINPGLWEDRNEGNLSGGFGLVQWTPATNLIDWAAGQGWEPTDIDVQLERMEWERANGEQYYKKPAYPITFDEFVTSTETPEYLAAAFLYNYERPKVPNEAPRAANARYWFNYLADLDINWLPVVLSTQKRRLSLLLMYAATRRGV